MQLLSFDSRYFAISPRRDYVVIPDLVTIRERHVSNAKRNCHTPKPPAIPRMCPENVLLGTAGRKHFRNPGEFLSRLAKGQAAGFLRLINRFPIMERE